MANDFAREFADDLRILMYGDCDMPEQIKRLAQTLAKYDGVGASWDSNKLLNVVLSHPAQPFQKVRLR